MPAVSGVTGYLGAREQAKGAKSAARLQARGVEEAQRMQREFTDKAVGQLGTNFQSARDALLSGQERFSDLFGQSEGVVRGGFGQARQDIQSGARGAEGALSPSFQRGNAASQLEAALSGALGAEAQSQAYSQFQESPGTDWLRKKQEEARLRSFSRLGGGLGNQASVMAALAADEFGRAQTDFGNYFNRLSSIGQRGDAAAANIANIRSNLGTNLGNLSTSQAQALTGLIGTRAASESDLAANLANLFSGQGTATANAYMGAGTQQAQLAQNLGEARAGYDLYRAQNAPAWAQGLNQATTTAAQLGGKFMGF